MKYVLTFFGLMTVVAASAATDGIDRHALVERNNPRVTAMDTLASLSVGNGEFAFTVDVTGLQSFPEMYANGVPLGTQSQWGWHSFLNPENYKFEETLRAYDFGRGRDELYSVEFKEPGRAKEAAGWMRVNPHRLHLGAIGFAGLDEGNITDVRQTLDMWEGCVKSEFKYDGEPVSVRTCVHPDRDMVAATITSAKCMPVTIRMPYPTGKHSDDGCDWTCDKDHLAEIVATEGNATLIKHTIDSTVYYVRIECEGAKVPDPVGCNEFIIVPESNDWSFTATFSPEMPFDANPSADETIASAAEYWGSFWTKGAAVDFSRCADPRAAELERRVVLSQYLLAIQSAGSTPPQETGLTYNSWFGKFHLEMIWWHQSWLPLYGHEDLLERTLPWYSSVRDVAAGIASRQGFNGVRWMKMTDPSGMESPSKVGSFLIWQQPHIIYLAELLYRANPSDELIERYGDLIEETAEFMADFAELDSVNDRYILRGIIPAQETLRAAETVNPPFELAYWRFALEASQRWRERRGLPKDEHRDEVIKKLSRLAAKDSLYLAAETAPDTYSDIRFTSDHPAVLGACGILPQSNLLEPDVMRNTLDWILENWNWNKTWGWDYPTVAMCAARLGCPDKAVDALLMDRRTNTYLPNGHNYQDGRLRCYLPGNGGLLTAVALMCAGWDGCGTRNPGFPADGGWDVRWEGLNPLP